MEFEHNSEAGVLAGKPAFSKTWDSKSQEWKSTPISGNISAGEALMDPKKLSEYRTAHKEMLDKMKDNERDKLMEVFKYTKSEHDNKISEAKRSMEAIEKMGVSKVDRERILTEKLLQINVAYYAQLRVLAEENTKEVHGLNSILFSTREEKLKIAKSQGVNTRFSELRLTRDKIKDETSGKIETDQGRIDKLRDELRAGPDRFDPEIRSQKEQLIRTIEKEILATKELGKERMKAAQEGLLADFTTGKLGSREKDLSLAERRTILSKWRPWRFKNSKQYLLLKNLIVWIRKRRLLGFCLTSRSRN